tara:strand:+ start:17340 stop:18518 length:1179 start_codon:yes stop_codon:yes gene_type:complete
MIPSGTILKNSCKPIHGFEYKHPFDGHGFINTFQIRDEKMKYKGIRVKTEHYKMEKKYNKKLFRGLNTNVKHNSLFIENFSNISVFHDTSRDEVQSLSEGGMPYLIDINDMKTVGRKFKHIHPFIPYFPITAHPKMDGGKVVNASGLLFMMALFDDDGILFTENFPAGEKYYFHDFSITDSHYIIYLNNIDVNIPNMYINDGTILDGFSFNTNNKILMVDKITKQRTYIDIPQMFDRPVLHIAHVVQKSSTVLDIYMSLIPSSFSIANIKSAYDFEGCFLHKFSIINSKIETIKQVSNTCCEMPVQSDGMIFLINENTLVKCDTKTDTITTIKFDDEVLEEPVLYDNTLFVITHGKNCTNIYTYIANSLAHVHTEKFPFNVSYGFHGTFVPF